MTRSTSNADASTGEGRARQTRLRRARGTIRKTVVGAKKPANPKYSSGDVARAGEARQRAEARQRDLAARRAVGAEQPQARGRVVQRSDRQPVMKVDGVLEHVVARRNDVAPVGALGRVRVDGHDPPARRAAGGQDVESIVADLDDVEPGLLARGDRHRQPRRRRDRSSSHSSLFDQPWLTVITSQRPSGDRSTLGQSVRSRPSPKTLASRAGSSPRRW